MKALKLAAPALAAALFAFSGAASAQSGTAPGPNTHAGPAQEGGRTQATPGYNAGNNIDTTGTRPNVVPGTAPGPNTHAGPAQEGGRTQASPGYSSSGNAPAMDTTGSVTPRSGIAPGPNTHAGPAQEGGRTQATPGPSR